MAARPKRSAPLAGRVRDLTQAGDAVVATDQGVVLTRGALPGESVLVAPSGGRRGSARARLLEVTSPSPARVEPACPVAERCGGCPVMTLEPAAQGALKLGLLQRALKSLAPDAPEPQLRSGTRALGYRRRARLLFQGGRLGYRTAHGHELIEATHCAVLEPTLDAALSLLREQLLPLLQGRGELQLALGAGARPVALLATAQVQRPELYERCAGMVEEQLLAGLCLQVQDGGRAEWGDPRVCSLGADGQPLWGPPGAFAQANAEVNAELVRSVVELAEPGGAALLELYAGHGNLTVALAAGAESLLAVEADAEAARHCAANLLARGLQQARVVRADAGELSPKGRFDCVVVDPPRAGLSRPALQLLLKLRPARLVYVSCDMASLRRDLSALHQAGYRSDAALAFDMFPQTAHLEAALRLRLSVG